MFYEESVSLFFFQLVLCVCFCCMRGGVGRSSNSMHSPISLHLVNSTQSTYCLVFWLALMTDQLQLETIHSRTHNRMSSSCKTATAYKCILCWQQEYKTEPFIGEALWMPKHRRSRQQQTVSTGIPAELRSKLDPIFTLMLSSIMNNTNWPTNQPKLWLRPTYLQSWKQQLASDLMTPAHMLLQTCNQPGITNPSN
jgi:hypothetical protein